MPTYIVHVALQTPSHSGVGDLLSYASERPLSPGTLVRVPLGTREVQFVAVRRANGSVSADAADPSLLAEGDTLVLRGLPKALALTEDLLLRGK